MEDQAKKVALVQHKETEMKSMKEKLRDIKNRMKMTNTLSGVPE